MHGCAAQVHDSLSKYTGTLFFWILHLVFRVFLTLHEWNPKWNSKETTHMNVWKPWQDFRLKQVVWPYYYTDSVAQHRCMIFYQSIQGPCFLDPPPCFFDRPSFFFDSPPCFLTPCVFNPLTVFFWPPTWFFFWPPDLVFLTTHVVFSDPPPCFFDPPPCFFEALATIVWIYIYIGPIIIQIVFAPHGCMVQCNVMQCNVMQCNAM